MEAYQGNYLMSSIKRKFTRHGLSMSVNLSHAVLYECIVVITSNKYVEFGMVDKQVN